MEAQARALTLRPPVHRTGFVCLLVQAAYSYKIFVCGLLQLKTGEMRHLCTPLASIVAPQRQQALAPRVHHVDLIDPVHRLVLVLRQGRKAWPTESLGASVQVRRALILLDDRAGELIIICRIAYIWLYGECVGDILITGTLVYYLMAMKQLVSSTYACSPL